MRIEGYKRCIKDCSTTNEYAIFMGLPTECKSGHDYFVVEKYNIFLVVFSHGQFCSFERENFIDLDQLRDEKLKELGI